MLSLSRLAVTASVAAALAVPAAAHARPDRGRAPLGRQRSRRDREGLARRPLRGPHPDATFVSASNTAVPKAEVVEADYGFEWGDAAIGGGAALLLTAVVGGAALTIRPRRAGALR